MAEEAREEEPESPIRSAIGGIRSRTRFLGLFPRRTAEHLVNAQKEGLLAVRSLLDRGIEILDSDLKRVHERPPRH